MERYRVVTHHDLDKLVERINWLIEQESWIPCGGLAINGRGRDISAHYYQAMTKDTP